MISNKPTPLDTMNHHPPPSNQVGALDELQKIAWRLSRRILTMTTTAGSGHPSSSLSCIDLLTSIYFGGFLRYDPSSPMWMTRDRLILSKGHAAPALYAVLAEAGYFDAELLYSLRQFGSPLEGHPNMSLLPGVEASTGSLGQGLSIGLGHALAARASDHLYRVYVVIGDGEADEGQIWEAAMAAAKFGMSNLTAIIDYNGFQQTGSVMEVMPSLSPLRAKWDAFGWSSYEVNGHDIPQIVESLRRANQESARPQVIIATTKKGRGLSLFEADNTNRRHGEVLNEEELEIALRELDATQPVEQ